MAETLPSEAGVEHSILEWLDGLGWEVYGLDGGEGAAQFDREYNRGGYMPVIYWALLRERLKHINDDITESNVDRFLNSLRRDLDVEDLMDGNREFHQLLRSGKQFDAKHTNGTTKPTYIDLIDFDDIENNHFVAANQFRVSRRQTIRPDITLFVNGIPLVQMELKSLAQNNDYFDAITDLQGYEEDVPRLFVPGLLNVAADTGTLRYGAVGAGTEYYEPWSDAPEEYQDPNEMKQAIQALCNPNTLLDILRNFVFFESGPGGLAKIVPRHMQYYAVHCILHRIHTGDSERGLIWHTQGSGKSFTMLYAAKNLLEREVMDSPQIVIIVDTDKLASQMRDTLSNVGFERSEVAGSIDHLQQLIEEGQSQLVLTTIQKFQDVEPNVQGNDEVVVMSDEAHRFMEAELGSRLDAAIPNCYHFGFTGTPVHEGESDLDRNTFREFSPDDEECLHRYSIKQGIEDQLILPVYFNLWHDVEWSIDETHMDEAFRREVEGHSQDEIRELIEESFTSRELGELEPRVEAYVEKLSEHFSTKIDANGWKGMVVTPSREAAALYGERLENRYDPGDIEVIYTAADGDSDRVRQYHTTGEERDRIIKRFKEEDAPKLLVVHSMLLTGFDAPILKAMYLDRNLQDHTLLQAIARTNRPAEGKHNGLIVDFRGVFRNIDEALQYDYETIKHAARNEEDLFEDLQDQVEELMAIFEDIPRTNTPESLEACLARISKHPERRQFKQGYRRLQDLYESVSPDGRLIESGIQAKYQWLNRIYVAFERSNNRNPNPENELREKTRDIVARNVDIEEIKTQYPIYKIGEEHLEAVEEMDDPAAKATSIAHATQDHLQPKVDRNPRYERLSERVNDVVERWQSGNLGDPEAVEALEQLEREVIELENEVEERGLTDAAFALLADLVDSYDDVIEDDLEAESLATDIYDAVRANVDTGFDGWHQNESVRKQIEVQIIDVLVKEHDQAVLVKEGDFVDDAREYLIQNMLAMGNE